MRGAIIYISSGREDYEFEKKIFKDMLSKKGSLPVYIVVQNFRDFYFGENCNIEVMGDVGTSGFNFCRQLQQAIFGIKEDYVISCEADCLYSPDYFTFVPPKLDRVYRNTNNFVMPLGKDYWHSKSSQTAFQIAGRNYLLDRLNFLLKGQPQWNTEMKNFPKEIGLPFLEWWDTFKTKYPCFTIKTGKGMRHHTASGRGKYYKLPYWGEAKKIRKEYLNEDN